MAYRLALFGLLLAAPLSIAEQATSLADADLAEIDRQLNNPLTSLWSLTFQNNASAKTGDAVDGTEYSNNLFFQPFLPFEVGAERQAMLTLRPVFPLVTQPEFDSPGGRSSSGHETGLGDIQLLTLAGPAAMLFHMGKPWTLGILAQHWESFAGDAHRADTSRTDVQYIIRRSILHAMSIGMGPTITYDWNADSDNALTLPVGLGITKTTRWGRVPVKLRVEVHYSIVKPDDYGTEWNLRLQVTPVISSPMK